MSRHIIISSKCLDIFRQRYRYTEGDILDNMYWKICFLVYIVTITTNWIFRVYIFKIMTVTWQYSRCALNLKLFLHVKGISMLICTFFRMHLVIIIFIYLPPASNTNALMRQPILPCSLLRTEAKEAICATKASSAPPPHLPHQKASKIQINIKIVLCVSKIQWTPLFSTLFAWIIQGRWLNYG